MVSRPSACMRANPSRWWWKDCAGRWKETPGSSSPGWRHRTREALACRSRRAPDITLVDHEDDPAAALELVEELGKALSRTHAVLWVRSLEDLRASQALQAGARAILVKNRPLEILLECLRVVARGHLWFENARQREPAGEREPGRRRAPRLTPRERQVVTLLSQGLKNTEIARALEISPAP